MPIDVVIAKPGEIVASPILQNGPHPPEASIALSPTSSSGAQTYAGQVGAQQRNPWCELTCNYDPANVGQASTIQITIPPQPVYGTEYFWVSDKDNVGDFLQVGYAVDASDPTHAHPFYAYFPANALSSNCNTNGVICNIVWTISWTTGWHTFWQASGADGVQNRWGFYYDSWSNRLGTVNAGGSNTALYSMLAATEGSGTNSINDVFPATGFHYTMQYLVNNQWILVRHADMYRGYGSSCPQLGLTLNAANDVVMGQNQRCPASGDILW